MFDHVKFGVSDYETSKTFFLEALRPLGVKIIDEGAPEYGVEMSSGDVSLCLFHTNDKPAPLHLAFVANTRQQVDDFYHAALRAGGRDNGGRDCVRTVKIIMPLLSSHLMDITSRPCAIRRRASSSTGLSEPVKRFTHAVFCTILHEKLYFWPVMS